MNQNQNQQSSLILSLPEDILMHCIARVPKQNYRNLSRVCKFFRSIVKSPDLFAKRTMLNCTETCIYVSIYKSFNGDTLWYTLIRDDENGDKKLVPVASIPPLPISQSSVSFGSKIYIFGGVYNEGWKSDVSIIDCRFDVAKSIGEMPGRLVSSPAVSDVVDGKIYVIRGQGRDQTRRKGMLMLDTETETWEYDTRWGLEEDVACNVVTSVAMDGKSGKIYVEGCYKEGGRKDFVFDSKEGKWEVLLPDEDVDQDYCESLKDFLGGDLIGAGKGCVIDEILYVFDAEFNCLRAYDLKERLYCGVVKGVEICEDDDYWPTKVICCNVNGNKKMVLLFEVYGMRQEGIGLWCAEVALMEKNENGEICGSVEWCQLMLEGKFSFSDCLSVIV